MKWMGMTWTVEFEPGDLWVGVYWKRDKRGLHLFICLIPCFPLHILKWGD